MTDAAISDLYERLSNWAAACDTSSPSSPPDYTIPDESAGFLDVVREWLDDHGDSSYD